MINNIFIALFRDKFFTAVKNLSLTNAIKILLINLFDKKKGRLKFEADQIQFISDTHPVHIRYTSGTHPVEIRFILS